MSVLINQQYYSLPELLPHAAPMLLLDAVLDFSEQHAVAQLLIQPQTLFYRNPQGVPAYIGIEYMAQTIALWSGIRRRQHGQLPGIGFLLGTRKYETHTAFFASGSMLTVRAEQRYLLDGMSVFACEISANDALLASANINAYEPQQADTSTAPAQTTA